MPGIVGLITKMNRRSAEQEVQRMVQALRHESFYETGTWSDESVGIYIGWIARHPSFPGGRPLESLQKNKILFFSGEDFSEPAAPFFGQTSQSHSMRSHSYLMDRVESDSSFPTTLNGRFQGVLVDKKAKTAQLFNDRYGLHRVYYHEAPEGTYFAAEAKAILAVRPELRRIDPRGLGELIANGCVLENRTVFDGIYVLPCASRWTFCCGELRDKGVYFQPKEWEEQERLDEEAYYEELRRVFSANIPKYFRGDSPVAVSLTGGLDSRMIMAWLKAPAKSVPCFSFGGPYRDCQDVTIARKVSHICGQEHQTIPVGNDFLSKFPHYAERTVYLTDGCVPVMHSPDLYINEIARGIAPVRMTGNYGGEVLRGIRAFKSIRPQQNLFSSDLDSYFSRASETYNSLIHVHPVSFSVFRQAPWHHYGLLALEETQLALRSPYLDNELVRLVFRAPMSAFESSETSLRLIRDGNPKLSKIPTDRGIMAGTGLWGKLRHQYQEFTFKAEYAYDYGMPQFVASVDHALSALHLERLFLGRHKFYHFRVWYRDALAKYIQEILLDSRTLSRTWLQRSTVESLVYSHIKGNRNHTVAIHKLLTLELLHRLFIDNQ